MKIFCMRNNNLFHDISFLCFFAIVFNFFSSGCESLPSKSDGPDNPLDPNNPTNIVQGPALVLSPTNVKINTGDEFQLELWIVEIYSVAGMSARINFDPTEFNVENVDSLSDNSESFFLQNGGQLIWFCTINNDSGFVQIDCAVVEGAPKDVKGRGVISRILLQHLSGPKTNINISSLSYLRNSSNDEINLNDLIGAEININ